MNAEEISVESSIAETSGAESVTSRYLSLTPAVMLAAQHRSVSISEFVELLQQQGFGGKRGCRKLVHRLERLGLLSIGPGVRGDRREKSILPTPLAHQQLRGLASLLNRMFE